MSRTVFVDADNTLWDTDGVYAAAQLRLLDGVELAVGERVGSVDRLAYVRAIDQSLAAAHQDGLRYPPVLLVHATALVLNGRPIGRATRSAMRAGEPPAMPPTTASVIAERFLTDLRRDPPLRLGVAEGLSELQEADCRVLVVTEARAAKVEATAERLGIAGRIARVLEGRKRPEFFRRVLRLVRPEGRAHMVGDQLDRDIVPARDAGLATVYFPGGFAPVWSLDEHDVRPDHRVSSFAEVGPIVLSG